MPGTSAETFSYEDILDYDVDYSNQFFISFNDGRLQKLKVW